MHDPAHAWNALTVGAFTDRVSVQDPSWLGWEPVAVAGDLSPWSTTSVTFAKQWPLKPDVVFEGGNLVRNSKGEVDFPCPDLCLVSTHYKPAEKPFVLTYATSAATAQAARMAAIIKAQYPPLWPETVRGLIVHSAEWTRAMQGHLRGAGGKRKREMLVRRYGFGVPRLSRALRSASDSLTLIAQGSIRPFVPGKDPKKRSMGDIHFFELPWPTDVLQSLGEQPGRLRVTLSYFIEPNPGRRGWTKPHRYASHGLRFDVKGPTESLDEFRKRLNQQALEEEEDKPKADGTDSWYLGPQARNHSSVHSDHLQGFAADLAERGVVGIYPSAAGGRTSPPATAAAGAPATRSSSRSKPTRRTSTSGHLWPTRLGFRSRPRTRSETAWGYPPRAGPVYTRRASSGGREAGRHCGRLRHSATRSHEPHLCLSHVASRGSSFLRSPSPPVWILSRTAVSRGSTTTSRVVFYRSGFVRGCSGRGGEW